MKKTTRCACFSILLLTSCLEYGMRTIPLQRGTTSENQRDYLFLAAVGENQLQDVQRMLEKPFAKDILAVALDIAIAKNNPQMVQLLLAYDANPNIKIRRNTTQYTTPIHRAIEQATGNSLPIIKTLVEAGANLQEKDSNGKTAFAWLAEKLGYQEEIDPLEYEGQLTHITASPIDMQTRKIYQSIYDYLASVLKKRQQESVQKWNEIMH